MEWLDQNADDFAWGKAADPDYYAFPHCPTIHRKFGSETPSFYDGFTVKYEHRLRNIC
ncbi:unknown protein [Microcystis aeruginosa NIES-843]|nr:unknown protein [Microcystis aeruginosa NIES-843]